MSGRAAQRAFESTDIGGDFQPSERGYEGSSEESPQQPTNTLFERRRSRSWLRRAQQIKHGGRKASKPNNHRNRWRNKMMQKQARNVNDSKMPSSNAARIATDTKQSNDLKKEEDDIQCCIPAPIPSVGSARKMSQEQEQKRHQQQQVNSSANQNSESGAPIRTRIIDGNIKITFHVQLAHGSPTGIISGFNSLKQLYQAIADCYDEITVDDILFCTVNTHRINMDALMCSTININDFIFAHIAGQKKEVTLVKSAPALGLTITDNGFGKAFIKRIVPGTITSKAKPALEVGDFIEKINGENMAGKQHIDVARYLRTLPVGSKITMRLIEPKRSGFNFVAPYHKQKQISSVLNPQETIRFKADGTVILQELPNATIISKINDIFDSYFGFHDNDLAQTVWELVASNKNLADLITTIKKSELNRFNFPEELYYDLWGAVDDYRNGRLSKVGEAEENNNEAYILKRSTEIRK